jgi:hypothetical protein
MDKQLFKWYAKCTAECANVGGILELHFVTETDEAPSINCGPCGDKAVDDVTFVESYTVTE